MSNRQSLLFMVVVATLSIRLVDDIGERPFYAILYLILGIWIIWTIADYRRGKRVFIWQK